MKIQAEEAQLEGAVELATLVQTSLEDSRPGHSCEQTDSSLARRLSTFRISVSTWDTTRRLLYRRTVVLQKENVPPQEQDCC